MLLKCVYSLILLSGAELLSLHANALAATLTMVAELITASFRDPNDQQAVGLVLLELCKLLEVLVVLFPQPFFQYFVFSLQSLFKYTQEYFQLVETQQETSYQITRQGLTLQHFFQLCARLFTQNHELMLSVVLGLGESGSHGEGWFLERLMLAWLNPGRRFVSRLSRADRRARLVATIYALTGSSPSQLSDSRLGEVIPVVVHGVVEDDVKASALEEEIQNEHKEETHEETEVERKRYVQQQDPLLGEDFRLNSFVYEGLQEVLRKRRNLQSLAGQVQLVCDIYIYIYIYMYI